MGLIDRIFGRTPKAAPAESVFQTLTAYSPVFRSWGGQIYESELVRAAVDAKARHVGKLQYSMQGTARPKLWTATKTAPNPWYTWPQFLERCSNIYDVQNNLFIVPILDEVGEVAGYFPALPSTCEVVQRENGEPYLKYTFVNGQKRSVPLRRCALVTKHQLKDDFFGESNAALAPTMELVNMVNQGIMEGVKNAATYRFMAQLTGKAFDEDLRKERERFDRNNFQTGGGGLLLFGNQMQNIKELSQKQVTVDPDQMAQIKENVCDYFGVSEKVLRNEATGDELDAFFNGAIEPFAIKLSDALTRMVFTERERNGGNGITFTANRLQYMNIGSKISMAQQLGDRGVLTIDEIRELFNYAPLPDGAGAYTPIRGEYKNVKDGDQDQDGGKQDE
jgi:HK97 family phage portal protein